MIGSVVSGRNYQTEPRSRMARNAAAATTNVRPMAAAVHRMTRDKFMRVLGCLFKESRVGPKSSTPRKRAASEQNRKVDVSKRGHRPPFTPAPVADSQRSSDPLLFTTSARADSQRRWPPHYPVADDRKETRWFATAMEDPYHDLVLAMLTLAIAGVLLVAGGLYLITTPDRPPAATPAAPIVTSSMSK